MDHFGIGQAMQGMAEVYFRGARQSGRTTSLIESLKDGDRVVCADAREADRLKRLCEERKIKAKFIVLPPAEPSRIFERGTSEGRTLFDHSWIEMYFMGVLKEAELHIDHLQRESSGFGTAHYETRHAAIELSKWR